MKNLLTILLGIVTTIFGLKKAKQELDILKLPEEERKAYERYLDDLHYQASMIESSYGWGIKKGKEEGIKEGLEKGKKEGRIEVAISLLDVLDIEIISVKTGLSIAEIESLKEGKL